MQGSEQLRNRLVQNWSASSLTFSSEGRRWCVEEKAVRPSGPLRRVEGARQVVLLHTIYRMFIFDLTAPPNGQILDRSRTVCCISSKRKASGAEHLPLGATLEDADTKGVSVLARTHRQAGYSQREHIQIIGINRGASKLSNGGGSRWVVHGPSGYNNFPRVLSWALGLRNR